MEDSRQIQEYLKRNKAAYDAERVKEWKERKQMHQEGEQLRQLRLAESAAKEQALMEEELREFKEEEINSKWSKYLTENEIEKQEVIQQLIEASNMRKNKVKSMRKRT